MNPPSPLPHSARAYLEDALHHWDNADQLPDESTLRQLALEANMTPQVSNDCDLRSGQLTDDARDFLNQGKFNAAEEALRQAVLLAPLRLEPLYLLARLYGDRFRGHRRDEDHHQALALANRCQELDPTHAESKALIQELEELPGHGGISWKQAGLIVFVLVFLSGSMSLCVRYTMIPEAPEGAAETFRQSLQDQPPPP